MRKALLAAAVLAVLAGALMVAADEREESTGPAAETNGARTRASAQAPVPAGLEAHLDELARIAARNGGNRAAGTKGYDESVAYVAGRLRQAGYEVRLQRVTYPRFDELARPRLSFGGRRLRQRRDVRTLAYSGSGSVRARVRPVANRGCSASDYQRVRRGEVALVPRGPCTLRRKAAHAQSAGAAAVLIVNNAPGTFPGTLGSPGIRIPALVLSEGAGRDVAGRSVAVATRTISERSVSANVIAETPQAKSGDVVMAGAHLDSVTEGPGMNDNGSGVAALLDVAERLADSGRRLRFGFWAAEELGLYGSRRYVTSLPDAERRRIVAYLNLDVVGTRGGRRAVYDTDDFVERAVRRGLEEATDGEIREQDLGGSSDHAPFQRAGIPVGGLHTGVDRCYHQACDRRANVDEELLGEMADATEAALVSLNRR